MIGVEARVQTLTEFKGSDFFFRFSLAKPQVNKLDFVVALSNLKVFEQ